MHRLAGVDVPCAAAAGWAVDLYLGRRTRDHRRCDSPGPRCAPPRRPASRTSGPRSSCCNAKQDEVDLDNCLPVLDAAAWQWLRAAIQDVHPGHGWLAALS
ncbi:hypothetical protein ACQEVB_27375 [Pseudonocardia sp. CA-107938]|uniref:hypothetical protein n=1 Tax=Pseudonocardia sp. CA-107938 TaxID=3240021 RepID=UPI003D8B5EE4